MRIGDILLLVGLGLATLAGAMLAYDGIYGAGARFKTEVAATNYASFVRFRAEEREVLRNLQGSYTDEDRQALLDDEEKRNAPQETRLKQLAESIPSKHSDRVVTLAANGVLLLILAFALQFVGTLMLALEHAS